MLMAHVSFYEFSRDLMPHFSYDACKELYDYYNDEDEIVIHDPIAIKVYWSENNPEEILDMYSNMIPLSLLHENKSLIDWLKEHTIAYSLSNGKILFESF